MLLRVSHIAEAEIDVTLISYCSSFLSVLDDHNAFQRKQRRIKIHVQIVDI